MGIIQSTDSLKGSVAYGLNVWDVGFSHYTPLLIMNAVSCVIAAPTHHIRQRRFFFCYWCCWRRTQLSWEWASEQEGEGVDGLLDWMVVRGHQEIQSQTNYSLLLLHNIISTRGHHLYKTGKEEDEDWTHHTKKQWWEFCPSRVLRIKRKKRFVCRKVRSRQFSISHQRRYWNRPMTLPLPLLLFLDYYQGNLNT